MAFLPLLESPDRFLRVPQCSNASSSKAQPSIPKAVVPSQIPEKTPHADSEHGSTRAEFSCDDPAISAITSYEQQPKTDRMTPEPSQESTAAEAATKQDGKRLMDYEMHYEISQRSVKDVVKAILDDFARRKNLHDWDDKIVQTPLKRLEYIVRDYLAKCSQEMLNDLLIHSSVEEVADISGKLESTPVMQQVGQAQSHLFFSKASKSFVTILKYERLLFDI